MKLFVLKSHYLFLYKYPTMSSESSTITANTQTHIDKFTSYANRGITGLTNLGNTCFINSCIQCLSHTYEFNEFLSKWDGNYRKSLNIKPDSVLVLFD